MSQEQPAPKASDKAPVQRISAPEAVVEPMRLTETPEPSQNTLRPEDLAPAWRGKAQKGCLSHGGCIPRVAPPCAHSGQRPISTGSAGRRWPPSETPGLMTLATTTLDDIGSGLLQSRRLEDRYRYIIELGRALPPLDPALKTEATKVRGCTSQVWLVSEAAAGDGGAPRLTFRGESDAHIVQGLVAIMLAVFNGKRADEILSIDAKDLLERLGLKDHLSPQRSNGLASMVERIRSDARAQLPG